MKRRAYISVFASGLGHASRMLLVAQKLASSGVDVYFSSSSEAALLVKKSGFICLQTPSIDVAWAPDGGVAPLRITLRRIARNLPTFARQIVVELKNLRRVNPSVVISDSKLSTIIAARILGIPTMTVLNQLRIFLPVETKTRMRSLLERLSGEILSALWSLSLLILIPDLPPPNTISYMNVSGTLLTRGRVRFVGFTTERNSKDANEVEDVKQRLRSTSGTPLLFAQVSGPTATRRPLIRTVIGAAERLRGRYVTVVSEGNPAGRSEPVRESWGWRYEWCPDTETLFSLADLLVIRGGHTSISKAILAGKPMVVIPIERHSEQYHNVSSLKAFGAALVIEPKNLSESSLVEAVEIAYSDRRLKARVEDLRRVAERMDGVEAVVNEALTYLR